MIFIVCWCSQEKAGTGGETSKPQYRTQRLIKDDMTIVRRIDIPFFITERSLMSSREERHPPSTLHGDAFEQFQRAALPHRPG
jgi:hypothetical protein